MGTDDGILCRGGGAMHRDMFTKHVVIPDAQAGRGISIFQILGRITDDRAGMKPIMRPDGRVAGEIDMRPDGTMRAENHMLINHRIRADPHRGIDLGLGMNDSGSVNHLIRSWLRFSVTSHNWYVEKEHESTQKRAGGPGSADLRAGEEIRFGLPSSRSRRPGRPGPSARKDFARLH